MRHKTKRLIKIFGWLIIVIGSPWTLIIIIHQTSKGIAHFALNRMAKAIGWSEED